jgi:hypothetical protein
MRCLGWLLVLVGVFTASAVNAQDSSVFQRGEAVVTGFSGTKAATPPPAAGDPLDETFIDLEGAPARILKLEPGAPPSGQLITAPSVLNVKAGDIGQVFATALDDGLSLDMADATPNIYLGATSAYGLQIVVPDADADGRPERVRKGQPNARWMAGQFGLDRGGGPGSIYRIDGKTGVVSLFTTIPGNGGPGLGDIVFDKATQQFFVSDLDTGLIHRLDAAGKPIDTFDHGLTGRPAGGLPAVADDGVVMDIKSPSFDSEDSKTWGLTQPERRVWGMELRAGRLYYTAGPEIWSVSINLDGTFGGDPRREIEVSGTPNNNPISDIAFDNQDYMYVAQRGGIKGSYDYSVFADAKQSVVFRFKREIPDDPATPGIWVPVPDEYAIGFPPDHRNTSGGVALGYGYDQAGAIRLGACDVTVWTTGDMLLDKPGSIVHGLQGNDRALTRPDNEPPAQSYFVDYDGRLDDPNSQGHVGDVEIWQPCDQHAEIDTYTPGVDLPPDFVPPIYVPPGETPPDGWQPDDEPPIGTPGYAYNLRLEKRPVPDSCLKGGLGFLCDYFVRVTNTGPDTYFGPIVVNDKLPAAPAGAVMTVANAPPWFCFPVSASEQQCTYPPTVLYPGDSIDLGINVNLAVAAPVCSLDNIAGLVWPPGLGDIDPTDDFDFATAVIPADYCVPPAEAKTNLKIWKDPFAQTCTDKGNLFECKYLVIVRNIGGGTYNGPIKVEDTIPAGTTALFPQPSWNCTGPAPTYACETGPVVLLPGQAVNLNTVVKVPKNQAGPLQCKAENKAKIVEAPGGSDQNTDATDDEAQAMMIIPGKISDCQGLPPMSNLKLKKMGPPERCPVVGGNWECIFKLTVQNFGATYTNEIQFLDALPFGSPAGATMSFQTPPNWTCGQVFGTLYQCNSNNPNLPHLAKAEFLATVKIPVAPLAKCEITNNATIIKAMGGTLLNSFAGDDTSSAKAKVAAVFPLNGDPPICLAASKVKPEPPLTGPASKETNLSIVKTGGKSNATASGQNTKFTVTITNEGPGVFNGPIEFRDTLFDGQIVEPSNGSFSAPWICAGQSASGHPEQGICTHPPMSLAPGESAVLNLEIEAPNSFVAPSGSQVKCGYKNKAEILKPAGGTPQNTNAGDDIAFADAKFAPFELHGTKFCELGLTTPPDETETNLAITKTAGACDGTPTGQSCPFTITVTNAGTEAHNGPIVIRDTLFDGQIVEPSNGSWSPPWTCEGQSAAGHPEQGICTHPPVALGPGESVVLTLTVEAPHSFVAPSGSQVKCGYKNKAEIVEPAGGTMNNTSAADDTAFADAKFEAFDLHGTTFCGPGLTTPPAQDCPQGWSHTPIPGKCCPPHTGWDGERCKRDVKPPKECPANSVGNYPDCRCKSGYTGTPPNCRKIEVPQDCTGGMVRVAGQCQCPQGTKFIDGKCRTPPPPKDCGPNAVGKYPNCRCAKGFSGAPPYCEPAVCPPGTRGIYPNCRKIVCESNKEWIDGACRCRYPTQWNGKRCVAEVPKVCPKDSVGQYPNCRCKRGTTGEPGNCQRILPIKCPKGFTGIPPNCERIIEKCPKGFRGTPPNCERIIGKCPRGFTGTPPNCERIIEKCPKGFRGTPPNCERIIRLCPEGFRGVPPNCRRADIPLRGVCPVGYIGRPPNCRPGTFNVQ